MWKRPEHAFCLCSNFNMLDSAAPFFHMPFFIPSTCLFFIRSNFNMPDSAAPFSTWCFHFFKMPFFIRSSFHMLKFLEHAGFSSTKTCWMQIHVFQDAGFHSHILWEMSTSVADNVNKYCSHFMLWTIVFEVHHVCMLKRHGEGVWTRVSSKKTGLYWWKRMPSLLRAVKTSLE